MIVDLTPKFDTYVERLDWEIEDLKYRLSLVEAERDREFEALAEAAMTGFQKVMSQVYDSGDVEALERLERPLTQEQMDALKNNTLTLTFHMGMK